MRQAKPGERCPTEASSVARRDKLQEWLLAEREQTVAASMSASLLGLSVTYEGKPLDPACVLLHRSLNPTAPPGDGAWRHAGDRAAMPGEFLG